MSFSFLFIYLLTVVLIVVISSYFGGGILAPFFIAIPFGLFVLVPINQINDLLADKICILFSPDNKIVITKPEKEQKGRNNLKYMVVYEVKATCPTCEKIYGFVDSVYLEKVKKNKRNRVIGICMNNPLEHRYSFDKDTLIGQKLED